MGKNTHGPGQPMAQLSNEDREMISVFMKKREALEAEIQSVVLLCLGEHRATTVAERQRIADAKKEVGDIKLTIRALRA